MSMRPLAVGSNGKFLVAKGLAKVYLQSTSQVPKFRSCSGMTQSIAVLLEHTRLLLE